ncbi:ATP-dependent RNA helicase [Dirofilaria immitis]
MNPNIGNVKMDRYRYSIPFYSIIIISTIIIATTASPTNDIYDKSSNHFALYKNEPNNDDSMLDEYFVADKRFQNDKGIKLPPVLIAFEKPVPMNPYSWQYMVKKKSGKIARNPYSWMNNIY